MKSLFSQEMQTLENFTVPFRLNDATGALQISSCEIPNLQIRVTHLANSISDESARIVVSKVLADLVFLLDYLSLVEAPPREPRRINERLAILEAVRSEAFSLVDFIENRVMQIEVLDELLRDTLDGSAYAIQHEVRRIFEGELAQTRFEQDEMKLHGLLLYAQGVLTNCFQQCLIGLARVFDDGVTGDRLFQDWRAKRERSLVLYRDLEALTEMLEKNEGGSLARIAEELQSFKEGSMQWLMYKDWYEYQALADPIIDSIRRGENPADLLHRLDCYLETLLAHVRARAVLADLVFEPCRSFEEVAAA
jgi:hypothetical protein